MSTSTTPESNTDIVTIKGKDYNWPDSIPAEYRPKVKPTHYISRAEVEKTFQFGSDWEMLEAQYLIDVNTLKKHFWTNFIKAQGVLKQQIIKSTVVSAVAGNHPAQRFLAINWLSMQDAAIAGVPTPQEYNEKEVNEKIEKLLAKAQSKKDSK